MELMLEVGAAVAGAPTICACLGWEGKGGGAALAWGGGRGQASLLFPSSILWG